MLGRSGGPYISAWARKSCCFRSSSAAGGSGTVKQINGHATHRIILSSPRFSRYYAAVKSQCASTTRFSRPWRCGFCSKAWNAGVTTTPISTRSSSTNACKGKCPIAIRSKQAQGTLHSRQRRSRSCLKAIKGTNTTLTWAPDSKVGTIYDKVFPTPVGRATFWPAACNQPQGIPQALTLRPSLRPEEAA